MLQTLHKKLADNVTKLGALMDEPDPFSEEKKANELQFAAEAHNSMFDLEMASLMKQVDNYNFNDESACTVVRSQIEKSYDRDLESAIKSLERSMVQCDEAIRQKIEISAEAVEAIIPALESKIGDRKKELAVSHDSSKLLAATVENNYFTMRDGYLELIKKVYDEASVQWKALLRLQEPNTRWHLEKLQKVMSETRDNPDLLQRREDLFHTAQLQLDNYCEHSFQRIKESKMYQEKEEHLHKVEKLKHAVCAYRAKTVRTQEELLNRSEIALDAVYMSSAEEVNDHLFQLQESLHQLQFYDRELTQVMVHAFKRELRMNRLSRAQTNGDRSGSVPKKGAFAANADEIVQLGLQIMQDMQSPFKMGTMLRSLAHSCDLPLENAEDVLDYVLFG